MAENETREVLLARVKELEAKLKSISETETCKVGKISKFSACGRTRVGYVDGEGMSSQRGCFGRGRWVEVEG
eukprot:385162-Amorphochlora_amoeboformis.AAC.1